VGCSRTAALWTGLLILLLLAAGDSVHIAFTRSLPLGCGRFQPLSGQQAESNLEASGGRPLGAGTSPTYAVHTLFLDDRVAQMARDVGFDSVVQVLPWRDINPSPGRYAWSAGDDIVRTAQAYGLKLVVRLDMPPAWAVRSEATEGLPFDLEAYADFVGAAAARYRGRIAGYIIWNEPNLAAEWSRSGSDLVDRWASYAGWVADPADYVGVLGAAYRRVKAADPGALVITAGLAPTNENSPRAMDDRQFLRQMLDAGAQECFDVLGLHAYGYGLPPTADRTIHDGLNLARVVDLHEILLEYDGEKRVWITELGYTIGEGQHPNVSEADQADYLVEALRLIGREWSWIDVVTVWNLTYGRAETDEMSGYSLVEPDLTPRIAYNALKRLLHILPEVGSTEE
jgi:hypothetical protein